MFGFKSGFVACALLFCSISVNAQDGQHRELESEPEAVEKNEHWERQSRLDEIQRKRKTHGKPKLSKSDLVWESLETHLAVNVTISGKNFHWKKRFTEGTQPEFSSLREKLKPGIYQYHVTFIPNEVEKEKAKINTLASECQDLTSSFEIAVQNGDADMVKELYWQRIDQSKELNKRRQQQANRPKHDYIIRTGKIVIDADGDMKEYEEHGEDDRILYSHHDESSAGRQDY